MPVDTTQQRRAVPLGTFTRFVGREAERALLADGLARKPSVWLIEGEAGVGKTRILGEVLGQRRARGDLVLVGCCRESLQASRLAPVADALRSLREPQVVARLSPVAGAVARFLPELASWLPDPPGPLADVRSERHRLYRGLGEILGALGPVTFVVEDLHWADKGTQVFLDYLLGQMPDHLAVACTYRAQPAENAAGLLAAAARLPATVSVRRLTLDPLDVVATADFVAAMLGGQQVSEEFANYLWDKTGGLPFALEEVLRLLADRDDLVQTEGRWVRRDLTELGVPPGIAATVHQRMHLLPPAGIRALQAAAVLGITVDEALVARIAGMRVEAATDGMTLALEVGLLVEAGSGVEFRHALARQAVYEGIAGPQRRQLHLRAAEALGEQPAPQWGLLAHHYREAGRSADWLRCAAAAAAAAVATGDDTEAIVFLQDIVAHHPDAAVRGRAAVSLGEAALHAAAHTDVLPILINVLDAAWLPAQQRGELRLLLGWLVARTGDAAAEKHHVRRAIHELSTSSPRRAEALCSLAQTNADATLDDQMGWLDEAERAARREGDPAVITRVVVTRAAVLIGSGDPRAVAAMAAVPTGGRSLAQTRQLARGRLNIANALANVGRYEEAETNLAEGARLAASFYDRFSEPFDSMRLLLRWVQGDLDDLERDTARLLTSPFSLVADEARLVAASMLLLGGETSKGELLLRELVRRLDRAGQFPLACWARGELAASMTATGRADDALAVLADGLTTMRRKRLWTLASDLVIPAVQALNATGDGSAADVLLNQIDVGLQGRVAPAAAAALTHARAMHFEARGDTGAAAAAYANADAEWLALPRPLHSARARKELGRCLLEVGDHDGEKTLRSALEVLFALGAKRDENQVRQTLRDHGLSAYRQRGRRSYGNELSPREREVARLAADGKTNREIAELLVLSPKTVGHHVSSVLSKLGVASRNDLKGTQTVSNA